MTDDNVTRLPVRFKEQPSSDRTVLKSWEIVRPVGACNHTTLEGANYIVDPKLAEVECSKCGAKLNPIWVLERLATEDRRMAEARAHYVEESKRLAERSRTKCEHCQKMTRISRR